jgi:transcriptional regulator with XRE-family HTH domain
VIAAGDAARVTSRERPGDRAARRARADITGLTRQLRDTRMQLGMSQEHVRRQCGVSRSRYSRIELGRQEDVSMVTLAELLAVVGLELSLRAYPAGEPVRDAAHRRLLGRVRALLPDPAAARWATEVPFPNTGDPRAWDATVRLGATLVAFEAETHPRDVQALQRRLNAKRRDGGVDRLVLALAETRHNRQILAVHGQDLRTSFPGDSARTLASLRSASTPDADAIIVV